MSTVKTDSITEHTSGAGVSVPVLIHAGAGINFGQQTLTDYEEGTFTPSAGGTATYTAAAGKYVRIGKVVHILCDITINALGTGSPTVLTGLPFAATTSGPSPLFVTYFNSIASSVVLLNAFISTLARTSINLAGLTAAAASVGSVAILGNGARVIVGGSYFID